MATRIQTFGKCIMPQASSAIGDKQLNIVVLLQSHWFLQFHWRINPAVAWGSKLSTLVANAPSGQRAQVE
ncbi:hypothetical protein [Aeromonas hydrophila]|uniref:hypothetical protein n=1 Tax=Aeromonas hydrophila TaxID=644 RepID=UPI0011C08A1E|nr:hypothetical protein [Aeromonas hydrophila]QEE13603.1 hypothetical protein C1A23_25490 [Aeromonas hydrophila subsp. hydrophila]